MKYLISVGADIDMGTNGMPCLHIAADNGLVELCQYLISLGADVHETDGFGYTPLHIAVASNHVNVCKYVISYRRQNLTST